MRIAFYAPLKAPTHPVPSGDRGMARLMIAALERAGHQVVLASTFRSRDGSGDAARQRRLAALGERLAERYVRQVGSDPDRRPALWLTYHLYHKAPDWLGPHVASALGIPYVVVEASVAPKRANGLWRLGYEAALAALRRADAVIGLNETDRACVLPALAAPERYVGLRPFVDTGLFAGRRREAARAFITGRFGLDSTAPWLVAVGMMRPGDKLASYRLLAEALRRLCGRDWRLLVVGGGSARADVMAAFHGLEARTAWLGELPRPAVLEALAAADLFVWPAINEAYGMALLEAQAAGLSAVAGAAGGVPAMVAEGLTASLVPPGDPAAFATAVAALLDDPARRQAMGAAAARRARAEHDIGGAAVILDALVRRLVA